MRPSEALAEHRELAKAIISKYPVSDPRVFGSTARGSDTEESDLDIIVKRGESLSYFDLFKLQDELSHLLNIKVDVRTEGEFSSQILERIRRDFVKL